MQAKHVDLRIDTALEIYGILGFLVVKMGQAWAWVQRTKGQVLIKRPTHQAAFLPFLYESFAGCCSIAVDVQALWNSKNMVFGLFGPSCFSPL